MIRRPVRRNSDEDLRALERSAAQGDTAAAGRLLAAQIRAGTVAPAEVERLARGCDKIALEVLGEACGDRVVLEAAGKKTKFTAQEARNVIESWYRANGYQTDPRSVGSLLSPNEQAKITFGPRVWRKWVGGRGHWHMSLSGSLPELAASMVAEAHTRVLKDKSVSEKLKERRSKAVVTKKKSAVESKSLGLVLRAAVVEASLRLTPDERREALLRADRGHFARLLDEVMRATEVPDGVTEAMIDARLSIDTPPVPLGRGTYTVRGKKVQYSGEHRWVDPHLGKPVRVWRPESGPANLGVEIGSIPVDPFRGRVSKLGMARSLVEERGAHDGLAGTIRVVRSSKGPLWAGHMFMIITNPPRAGAGTRYLRAWCHLLRSYGTVPRWVAQAVGDQGLAWLTALAQRGEVALAPIEGSSDLIVECLGPALSRDDPRQLQLFSNPRRTVGPRR